MQKITENSFSTPVQTPELLSREYTCLALLGEGAMGKTYLAQQIVTGELVAIKTLKLSQSENLKSYELFLREAEVMSSIDIQGVPKFYRSIISDKAGGECYIIQEYVAAPSLQTYLDQGRVFSEIEVIFILRQLSTLLHSLHTYYVPPIIHRDIKPSNILCNIEDIEAQNGQVWLIDFGAVANPQHKNGGSTVAGTYGYMAPEQMLGECTVVSDLYAVGATILHLLTGVSPVDMEADVFKLKYDKILAEKAPDTSEQMKVILSDLLEPEPAKRIQSADTILEKLEHYEEIKKVEEISSEEHERRLNVMKIWEQAQASLSIEKNYSYSKNWKLVPGTIRNVNYNKQPCYEYTFKIQTMNGSILYMGMYPVGMFKINHHLLLKKGPVKCMVAFNPANPRYNFIDSIPNAEEIINSILEDEHSKLNSLS